MIAITPDTPFGIKLVHLLDQQTGVAAVERYLEWIADVPQDRIADVEPIMGVDEGDLRMEWESDDETRYYCAEISGDASSGEDREWEGPYDPLTLSNFFYRGDIPDY